ncbi:signal peptidase, endoplasmic reticulum-type [Clostridium collagenovorans DSM 3089]|uniref:Signal peptidase I n=1 Tax=Clostridium collagenovorans DSM 3089 TaxID=1121306 RepID=A0A1M5XI85_9CLOT|nr:signal peptidase I [Clostridium collagenovorans]SHH98973.1 signal peptidase, endoplasmic reticulum-type [Clostridium collagenovorans DSM 3089]
MIKKICNIGTTIILIVMIAIAALLLVPKIFGYDTYAVLSGSMEPKFHVGSMVFVKKVQPSEIQVGDPISFFLSGQGGNVATHRVVEVESEKEYFITKGDANNSNDTEPVKFNSLIGKVMFNVPLLGYLTIYIKTKQGMMIALGILILLILGNFIPELLKKED